MDDQVTARALVCAIPKGIINSWLLKQFTEMGRQLTEATSILKPGMGPDDAHKFESCVEVIVREQARSFVEWCFNFLEPSKVHEMPRHVDYQGQKYRQLKQKTVHANILTRFGNITLFRATWRQGSRGCTISPLEKILGVEFGATPGAQDLLGRQIAAAGSSQSRCIEVIGSTTFVACKITTFKVSTHVRTTNARISSGSAQAVFACGAGAWLVCCQTQSCITPTASRRGG